MRTLTETFIMTSLCHPGEAPEPEMVIDTNYGHDTEITIETRYSGYKDGPNSYQAFKFGNDNKFYSIDDLKRIITEAERVKELDLSENY